MGDLVKLRPDDAPIGDGINIDPDKVLTAHAGKCSRVVVIGTDKETGEFFVAGSESSRECLWMMEYARLRLMGVV